MPILVYRYLPGKLLKLKARETDDVPTILGQLFSTPSSADQHKADREPSNCEPSDDVWMYINRQRTSKMKWARLARTHFAALSACEDGFPGYARQEILVQRAMARASTVIYYPKEMHTDIMKEMESLGSLSEFYRRLMTATSEVVKYHYFPANSDKKPTSAEAFAMVSSAVCDANYIYERYDTHGYVREGPFRHPAIAETFSKVFFGDTTRDLYNFHTYFYPAVPHFLIVLICTALRCALDEMWTGEHVTREFSRDLYGEVLGSLSFRWVCLDPVYARETQRGLATLMHDMLVTGPTPQADESGEASEEEADVEPPLKKPRLLF